MLCYFLSTQHHHFALLSFSLSYRWDSENTLSSILFCTCFWARVCRKMENSLWSPKVTGDSERPESWHTPGSGQRDHQGRGLSGNNIVQSQQGKRNQLHSCVYSRNDSLAPIMCLIQLLEGAMEAQMSQTDQNPCPCGASLWARTWAETKLVCSNKWDKAPLPEPSGGQHLDGPPYGSALAQAVTPSHQTSGWATMAHFPLISQIP